jgi:hypothetical protein
MGSALASRLQHKVTGFITVEMDLKNFQNKKTKIAKCLILEGQPSLPQITSGM